MINALSKKPAPIKSSSSYDEFEEEILIKGKKIIRGYRFFNQLPLNKSNPDMKVNFLEYWEVDENGNGEKLLLDKRYKIITG